MSTPVARRGKKPPREPVKFLTMASFSPHLLNRMPIATSRRPRLPPRPNRKRLEPQALRLESLDLARGIAVALMILSHGVKGLLTFEQIPAWGLVPIHLLTKFSSTLFILVFGMSLAVAFLPSAGTADWPNRRRKLLMRGLIVLFWYKALTIVEMFHLRSRQEIMDALFYRSFPVYVEILGFYAIALFWVPWILPAWKKTPAALRWLSPIVVAAIAWYTSERVPFGDHDILKALLVESDDVYAWGQLSRGPLIFLGLLIGGEALKRHSSTRRRVGMTAALLFAAGGLGALFYIGAETVGIRSALHSIALNEGKHPPEQLFMLFSLGGALGIIALTFLGHRWLAMLLKPFVWIGRSSLQAFVFHILVIFVFYRYLFDLFHKTNYPLALNASLLLIGLTVLWVKLLKWLRNAS